MLREVEHEFRRCQKSSSLGGGPSANVSTESMADAFMDAVRSVYKLNSNSTSAQTNQGDNCPPQLDTQPIQGVFSGVPDTPLSSSINSAKLPASLSHRAEFHASGLTQVYDGDVDMSASSSAEDASVSPIQLSDTALLSNPLGLLADATDVLRHHRRDSESDPQLYGSSAESSLNKPSPPNLNGSRPHSLYDVQSPKRSAPQSSSNGFESTFLSLEIETNPEFWKEGIEYVLATAETDNARASSQLPTGMQYFSEQDPTRRDVQNESLDPISLALVTEEEVNMLIN
jgi:hypothetical protein